MQSDLPHTLYKRRKSKGKKGKKNDPNADFKFNPNDKAIKMQMEANERMRNRLRAEGRDVRYSMDEIFKK